MWVKAWGPLSEQSGLMVLEWGQQEVRARGKLKYPSAIFN